MDAVYGESALGPGVMRISGSRGVELVSFVVPEKALATIIGVSTIISLRGHRGSDLEAVIGGHRAV